DGIDNDGDGNIDELGEGIRLTRRIRLTVGTSSKPGLIYAGFINDKKQLDGLFRSVDAGAHWNAVSNLQAGVTGQGRTNFSMVADPTDNTVIYVCGSPVQLYRVDFSSGLWTPISGEANPSIPESGAHATAPHADSRNMVIDPGGNWLLESDDGGIYRLNNPANGSRQWVS